MFLKYDMPFSLTTLDLPKKYLFINSCYWSHWFCCEIKAALKVCIFGRKDMTSSGMSVNMRAFIQWPKLEFCAEVFFCAFHHFFTSSFLFCYAHKRRFLCGRKPCHILFLKRCDTFYNFLFASYVFLQASFHNGKACNSNVSLKRGIILQKYQYSSNI